MKYPTVFIKWPFHCHEWCDSSYFLPLIIWSRISREFTHKFHWWNIPFDRDKNIPFRLNMKIYRPETIWNFCWMLESILSIDLNDLIGFCCVENWNIQSRGWKCVLNNEIKKKELYVDFGNVERHSWKISHRPWWWWENDEPEFVVVHWLPTAIHEIVYLKTLCRLGMLVVWMRIRLQMRSKKIGS